MKVCFETFGCRLSKAEALQMESDYLSQGWSLAQGHADADLFVVRGCSVTARAQHECEKAIEHLRRHYPTTPIRIVGCIQGAGKATPRDRIVSNTVPTRTARAYLKVQDGCSGSCAFCIVPKFRGKPVSENFIATVDRAKRFIDAGYHEIVVTGCNLSLYASSGRRLPDLAAALADLDDACRIRIGSLEPGDAVRETICCMAERKNICRFLHLPIQSGSRNILKAMGRPYEPKDIEATIRLAAQSLPGLGLGCDIITGFPGESDLDFIATKGLLERLPFNNVHAFPYSERPGTPAAAFHGSVPKAMRSARAHELSRIVRGKRELYARHFIGKTVEVVLEDTEGRHGWTGEYLKCRIRDQADRKALVRVLVARVAGVELEGRLVQQA